jgi:hypothetical protein
MTPNNSEKIIDKIKKLLALAAGAGTEEEADAASGKVQELLASYNLSMAEVHAQPDSVKATTDAEEAKRVKDTYKRSAMYEYQQRLWNAIAKANFCWYFRAPVLKQNSRGVWMKATYHHMIVGKEVNVLAVRLMGDYLEETINRLCPYKPGRDSSRSWISWKEGCAARLGKRLQDRKVQMEEASAAATTTALVRLSDVFESEYDENFRFMYGEESYQLMKNPAPVSVVVAEPVETDAQRRAREDKEFKYWQKHDAKQKRERERYWSKRDLNAWREGEEVGNDIGLDAQVKDRNQKDLK